MSYKLDITYPNVLFRYRPNVLFRYRLLVTVLMCLLRQTPNRYEPGPVNFNLGLLQFILRDGSVKEKKFRGPLADVNLSNMIEENPFSW